MLFGLCPMNCWASSTELPIPPKPAALALPGSTAGACRGKDCTSTLLPAETLQWVWSLAHPCSFPSEMALLLHWALLCVWRRPGWRFNQNSPRFWACRVWYQVTALQASSCLQWIVQQLCPAGSPRYFTACASHHFLTQHPSLQRAQYPSSSEGPEENILHSCLVSSPPDDTGLRDGGTQCMWENPNICLIFKERGTVHPSFQYMQLLHVSAPVQRNSQLHVPPRISPRDGLGSSQKFLWSPWKNEYSLPISHT